MLRRIIPLRRSRVRRGSLVFYTDAQVGASNHLAAGRPCVARIGLAQNAAAGQVLGARTEAVGCRWNIGILREVGRHLRCRRNVAPDVTVSVTIAVRPVEQLTWRIIIDQVLLNTA